MTFNLSSRFSDSTIASASTSFSKISCASSASSVEDLRLPSFGAIPKPPPRTSSITVNSTKTYDDRRERKKPAPLQLASSKKSTRTVRQSSTSSSGEDSYFSCGDSSHDDIPCYRSKCFCGSVIRPSTSSTSSTSTSIYCSKSCARQDALYALEGRSPTYMHASEISSDNDEEDDDFPVTPTNAFVPSPPRTPAGKGRILERQRKPSLMRKMTGLGASHYRRMEALGLYDVDVTPTRPSKADPLMEPIDLMVAHSPSGKASFLPLSLASSDEEDEPDFNPRKTLFFPIPIYMSSPTRS